MARPPKTVRVCVAPSTPVWSKFSELDPVNGPIGMISARAGGGAKRRGAETAINWSQRRIMEFLIVV